MISDSRSVVVVGDQAKISDREYAHVSRAPYYGRFETGSSVVKLPAIIVTLICATMFSCIASFSHVSMTRQEAKVLVK